MPNAQIGKVDFKTLLGLANLVGHRIRRASFNLASPYHIDFITETGFSDYVRMIEKEVGEINESDWPVPSSPPAVAPN